MKKINREETVRNGRSICEQYYPLIQARRNKADLSSMFTTSIIKTDGKTKGSAGTLERKVLEKISWEDDPVSWFLNILATIQGRYPKEGEYLYYRYFKGLSHREYYEKVNCSRSTADRINADAHYLVAVEVGTVAYGFKNNIIFTFHP